MAYGTDNGEKSVPFFVNNLKKYIRFMSIRKEIIGAILSELNSRGGFDDWWHNIDEDIQEEITETLVNLLPTNIDSNNN